LKRRKDRGNEGFLFAKRREEELDGTTKKMGQMRGDFGSNPLLHFTGGIFLLQIFVVSEASCSFQQGAVW
jgi:hypothetical protein